MSLVNLPCTHCGTHLSACGRQHGLREARKGQDHPAHLSHGTSLQQQCCCMSASATLSAGPARGPRGAPAVALVEGDEVGAAHLPPPVQQVACFASTFLTAVGCILHPGTSGTSALQLPHAGTQSSPTGHNPANLLLLASVAGMTVMSGIVRQVWRPKEDGRRQPRPGVCDAVPGPVLRQVPGGARRRAGPLCRGA
jgi:hypothetical protein